MKTDYITSTPVLPPYLVYPRFLLGMDLRLITKEVYCILLDKDDDLSGPSASIQNQRELLCSYCEEQGWRVAGIFQDDGYTGLNMDRPDFQRILGAVERGMSDVILTKDLSRLGRNYLQTGQLIEEFFPKNKVRYITLNDAVDSNIENDITPFRNILNKAYCRDTSIKIRSQFEIKRQRGDFIGSFAVFGYRKDPEDRRRLLVDDYAADVVRDIFKWKLGGVSAGDIADRLTAAGIPTPMDYKRSLGMRYSTSFRVKEESVWDAGMVLRILKNRSTPAYRSRGA